MTLPPPPARRTMSAPTEVPVEVPHPAVPALQPVDDRSGRGRARRPGADCAGQHVREAFFEKVIGPLRARDGSGRGRCHVPLLEDRHRVRAKNGRGRYKLQGHMRPITWRLMHRRLSLDSRSCSLTTWLPWPGARKGRRHCCGDIRSRCWRRLVSGSPSRATGRSAVRSRSP
jgi:hypothetical protein